MYNCHCHERNGVYECVPRVLAYIVAPGDDGGARVGLDGALEVHIIALLDDVGVEGRPEPGRGFGDVWAGKECTKEVRQSKHHLSSAELLHHTLSIAIKDY